MDSLHWIAHGWQAANPPGYEFDLNWYGINALLMLGLARDLKAQKLNHDEDEKAAMERGVPA